MTDAIQQQAIVCTNFDQDLCCHLASLGHNEVKMADVT